MNRAPRYALAALVAAALFAPRPAVARHGDLFAELDCSACHDQDTWRLTDGPRGTAFDHDRTGFPLRAAHTRAACSGCHLGGGKPATTCEGCHRDPHQRRHGAPCAECHTATAWQDTRALEQHRRTRMPLTGRHATVDCSGCHVRNDERRYAATPTDCFACHRADYRRAAVPHKHDGSEGPAPFPRRCSECHSTVAWSPAFVAPGAITGALASASHVVFPLTAASHRTAECSACHLDRSRPQRVRCDTCHDAATVRSQHAAPVAASASACLACHPRGARRASGAPRREVRP